MSAKPPESNIYLLPARPVVIEVHSERLLQLMAALYGSGFTIKNAGTVNRFRVEDAKERK